MSQQTITMRWLDIYLRLIDLPRHLDELSSISLYKFVVKDREEYGGTYNGIKLDT